MRRSTLVGVLVAALVVATSSRAPALVVCSTPDGKTYVADKPPSGCVVKGEYANAPEEPTPRVSRSTADAPAAAEADENAFDAQTIMRRRRIEKDINEAADKLVDAREKLGSLEEVRPDWSYGQIQFNRNARDRSSSQESAATRRIEDCQTEFDRLTEQVREHHKGSLPASWSLKLNCRNCP
jgi:hypothetical protein